MKVRMIREEDAPTVGDVVYDKNPMFGFEKLIVTKVTKATITCDNRQYKRDGAQKGDKWGMPRLHVCVS